jgi:hypothetical protein
MCFNVGIIRITFKFLLIRNNFFFFEICDFNFFVVYIFLICIIVSIFFPTRITKLRKFETIKTCWGAKGG